MFFFVLVLCLLFYAVGWSLGEDGRSQLWKMLRPHVLPVTLIFAVVFLFGVFAVAGLQVRLF